MSFDISALAERLDMCAERMGGKRALASACQISEAQLYRYVAGDSIIPADRLLAIAKAARVDAGWLLTGDGKPEGNHTSDPRPPFRPELLTQIIQVFEELLVEYEKPFTPRQRARAINFIYQALRHDEVRQNVTHLPQKFDMLEIVSFLSELRTEEELDILNRTLNMAEYEDAAPTPEYRQLVTSFCNAITRGVKAYYNGYMGQVYFDRMGLQLDSTGVRRIHDAVTQACQLTAKQELDWLDIGCGNGRHISYLHRNMPNVNVRGLELSQRGVDLCATLSHSNKLPPQSVVRGDFRNLPYADNTFDVVYARMTLWQVPYFPSTGLGLEAAMEDIARVLRPKGIVIVTSLYGKGRTYLPFYQFLTRPDLETLARLYGLKVVEWQEVDAITDNGGKAGIDYRPTFDRSFKVVLQKPD